MHPTQASIRHPLPAQEDYVTVVLGAPKPGLNAAGASEDGGDLAATLETEDVRRGRPGVALEPWDECQPRLPVVDVREVPRRACARGRWATGPW